MSPSRRLLGRWSAFTGALVGLERCASKPLLASAAADSAGSACYPRAFFVAAEDSGGDLQSSSTTMVLPLSVAFVSVLLGAALALAGERFSRAMGVVRWFSLIAASAVVLGMLLPDAISEVGWVAVVVFLMALVMPVAVERLVGSVRGHKDTHAHDDCDHAHADADVGMELGYAGLLVHQLGDGFALSTYGNASRHDGAVLSVLLAIGLHTIPVAAFVVLAFFKHGGYRTAILRASGLVAATWLGVVGVSMAPVAFMSTWEPWLTAIVAGLLFHVVVHDFRWSRR